jgi:ribose transport system permease protein
MTVEREPDGGLVLSDSALTESAEAPGAPISEPSWGPSFLKRCLVAVSPKNLSLIYIDAVFLIIFAFWVPDLFYTSTTFKSLLYQQAVTGVAALAFLIPYTTLNFDLTVGNLVGVSSLFTCWLIVEENIAVPLAILISLIACGLIGCLTGFFITVLKIESVITTIAMLFIINALGSAARNGQQVLGLPSSYTKISSTEVGGIALPFFYLIVLGIIGWYVLTHTPIGRYLYATGGGKEAARLAGVQVNRLIFLTFVASAVLAGIAGVMVSSRVGTGDYTVGAPYLFPAAAAIFLGSTQVKRGVFNVWGTILAVYSLGLIVKGLELGGAPFWLSDLMNGSSLLAAVALSQLRLIRPANWRRRPDAVVVSE